jgi:SAM-dependent methyltransferase
MARKSGWDVAGTELSAPLVNLARAQGLDVTFGTVETSQFPSESFDCVAGFNFLEHVPKPKHTLIAIRQLLRPGGTLAVMCPNIDGIFHRLLPELLAYDPLKISWTPPYHLSYFNRDNLKRLLESGGFSDVEDHSLGLSCLWDQFEPLIGPEVTEEKLRRFIECQDLEGMKKALAERMAWTLLSDLRTVEPALKSEIGTLLLCRS